MEGCWQVEDTQWRSIAGNLKQRLRDQGMELAELDLEDDTGLRVYEVSKDGKLQYYLNLLSTDRGTIYVLNPRQMSRAELESAIGSPTPL
ncbi:hypothetical protein BST81_24745 [Leptolyngbya sp. 'hensonii']|nr:hypothetical protein BST81_24745 [Leptolyngbya sp. 'hensonii']